MAFHEKAFATFNPGTQYQPNWHLEAIGYQLARCASGAERRLIILAPPRTAKSQFVSCSLPAFILGRNPSARVMVASYGEQLSKKLSSDTRLIFDTAWYRQAFPQTIIGNKDQENYFQTTRQGFRLATTVRGATTGLGADFLIVDDHMKAQDAHSENERTWVKNWFDQAFRNIVVGPG